MKTIRLGLPVVFASLALVAQETPRLGGDLSERFQRLDRNGDGKLTHEEVADAAAFAAADADKDGMVTSEELTAYYRRTQPIPNARSAGFSRFLEQ